MSLHGEANYRFRKLVWVSMVVDRLRGKNSIQMVHTRDGDKLEAWLTLEEDDMELFEHNVMKNLEKESKEKD